MSRYRRYRFGPSCLVAALLLAAGAGSAQSDLDLTRVTPPMEVLPRQTVNLVILVVNEGIDPRTESLTVELPSGWRLLVPAADISLDPGESTSHVFTVMVPQEAEAGHYAVRVRSRESEEVEFLLTVRGIVALEVTALDAPRLVVGEDYTATFSVRNGGNASTEISIAPKDSLNLRLETSIEGRPLDETSGLLLGPGESVFVEVRVRVPADFRKPAKHRLSLRVRSRDDPEITAGAEVHVDLIPRETDLGEAFHSFPLRLRAVATLDLDDIREDPDAALERGEVEVSGEGKLWDGQPGTFRVKLGSGIERKERRALVAYRLDSFRAAVGQQKFLSSPLLPDLEGVGAQVLGEVWTVDAVRVGGEAYVLADDSRWRYGTGWRLTLDRAFRGSVRLGLGEEESHFGTRWQVLPNRGSTSVSGATTELDVEYARRWRATGEAGSAVRVGAGFEAEALEGNASFIAQEGAYDGASSDSTSFTAEAEGRLALPFPDRFRARVRLNVDYPIGTLRGGARTIEGYDSKVDLELSGRLAGVDVGLGYVHEEGAHYGRFPSGSREDEYSIALVAYPDPVSQFRQRFGLLRTASSTRSRVLDTYLYLAGIRTSYGGGQLTSGLDLAYSEEQRYFTRLVLSGEWSGEISPELDLLAGADWALTGDRIARLELEGDYHPAPARQLAVGLRGDFYSNRKARFRLDLSLTEAFELRLGPLSNVGQVSGRVTDDSGGPREKIVIRLAGRSSVTDEEGRFLFPAVPEGSHLLSIHPESLASNELTVPATPLDVQVGAQTEVRQDLVLVEGAQLSGTIVYRAPEAEGTAWERDLPQEGPGSLAGIDLIMTNGQTVVRALSDARGAFEVTRLTPGEWRLSVESKRLSRSYRFAPAELIIDLEPGSNETIIEIQPMERAIRFIDGGVIEGEGKPVNETLNDPP